ncbi:serine hydrolase domain-containing protein [Fulvimonas sp. R45]|uniref:serine hydrolase domain-containing protein n=1 Tax=Fulvimonas sp. R45 TaxID=3045937 RepID=UPI00265EE6A9|nr:serine hydrolase domain-containing protein [Fulvimonas sp. R45]MDO1527657.1 serine hydrolase domain-containing protein [Fulvimonas sp. R45]
MPFRPLPLLIAGLLGLAGIAAAQPSTAPATTVASADAREALPPARLKSALADYTRWLDTLQQRNEVAGLATAVVYDGKVVYEHTTGYADAATAAKVTPDTVFRLASLSKAFATALAGLLVDDGSFGWDTRLVDVLPFFKLKDAQASAEATVRDILGQRIGLPRNTYDNLLEDNVPYEELVRKLDEVDLACDVGQCYGYQNVAFSLIGDVIYAKTGDFYYHQVDKRLFFPLGMHSASYGRAALEMNKDWARPHRKRGSGWMPYEPREAYYRVAPAAGVNASLRDMEKWLIAQMGGRPDVLPPALLQTLHAPGVSTPPELHSTPWRRARLTSAHYALGWRVFTYAGQTLIFHAGAVEGYRTLIGFFPKYRFGVVMLRDSPGLTPSEVVPMLFDSVLGLPHEDWAGVEHAPPAKRAAPRRRVRHRRR